jgi:hypothetical protein
MIIGLIQDGAGQADLKDRLTRRMQELGKRFVHDGKPIDGTIEAESKAIELIDRFMTLRRSNFERLGCI